MRLCSVPFPQSKGRTEQQSIRGLLQAGWNRVHTSLALHINAMQGIFHFTSAYRDRLKKQNRKEKSI